MSFRSVLVGDSFLEGYYLSAPLATLVERRWVAQGLQDMEAINLAIAATGPRQYYARIKKVALGLDPDVVAVFVYAGNDMIDRPFDPLSLPPLIDELPAPSLLGAVAPRTTWLIANRLRFSEIGRTNKDIPGEDALLNEWTAQPSAEPVARVARHMRLHYFPRMSEEAITELLLRGGGRPCTRRRATARTIESISAGGCCRASSSGRRAAGPFHETPRKPRKWRATPW